MRVLIEGWDSGEPVRALLDAPDASQVRAAERVTLQFEETASTSDGIDNADDADAAADGDGDGDDKAKTTPSPPLRLLLAQQPHLLSRTPPLLSSVVWDCGLALAEWLVEREARRRRRGGGAAAVAAAGGSAGAATAAEEGLTVVELGAGAGAPAARGQMPGRSPPTEGERKALPLPLPPMVMTPAPPLPPSPI